MNIVQIYNRTLYYHDAPRAPRFPYRKVVASINTAIENIVDDRITAGKSQDQEKTGFEVTQRLKDQLRTLVKRSDDINAVSSNFGNQTISSIPLTSIADHRHTIGLRCFISGKWYWTAPLDHETAQTIHDDPFSRPSIIAPPRIYRLENQTGCEVHFGDIGQLTKGYYEYIKNPQKVSLGTLKDTGNLSGGISLIALTPATIQVAPLGNTIELDEGQEYITAGTTTLISGTIVINYTNSDLPISLHEEIAQRAASILSVSIGKSETAGQ